MNWREKSSGRPEQTTVAHHVRGPSFCSQRSLGRASPKHTFGDPAAIRFVRVRSGGGSYRFAVLLISLMSPWADTQCREDYGSAEYQVKAAFLFHFAQFVEWPPDTFRDPRTPFTYCTVGIDPFRGALEESLSGKTIQSRPLNVRHLKGIQDTAGCQVLFLGNGERLLLGEAVTNFGGDPVLLVGESEHFVQDGGTIGFCIEDNKIRFEINTAAAEKAKLKISARLLALARTVLRNSRGN